MLFSFLLKYALSAFILSRNIVKIFRRIQENQSIAAAAAGTGILQAAPSCCIVSTKTTVTSLSRHWRTIGSVSRGSASSAINTVFALPAVKAFRSCLIPTTRSAVFSSSSTMEITPPALPEIYAHAIKDYSRIHENCQSFLNVLTKNFCLFPLLSAKKRQPAHRKPPFLLRIPFVWVMPATGD